MNCVNSLDLFIGNALTDRLYDPLVLSYLVHYQFEAIHPFRDGNGRVGRLLLALTTFAWQPLMLPWLYMSAYFERFKEEYVDKMFRVSTHGDWDLWIEYCLRGTIVQCKDAIRRCDALANLQERVRGALYGLPRMAPIIDLMFINPVFTAAKVAEWGGGTSLPTARRDIEVMERSGFVKYLTGERPKTYYVPQIFAIAYGEGDAADQSPEEPAPPESER